MSSDYENIKRRLDESIRKEEARQKILKKKREEKRAIKKGGGGHAIARAIMPEDTDFRFGHNTGSDPSEDIDARIRRESSERCMERVICKACGFSHGFCQEIKDDKEKLRMLPTGDNSESSKNRTRTGGLDFINAQDLSTTPKEGKILMVRFTEKGKSGPSITLKLAFDGKIRYLWVPARKSDPRYSVMLGKFGPDENDWVDSRIHLFLEKDDFSENFQVRIAVPEDKTKRK